ncbi:hypothetical protein ACHAXT_009080 [Thalassiosira profunda]
MSAIRQALDREYIALDARSRLFAIPRRRFAVPLPASFFVDEPRRAHLESAWYREVCPAIDAILRFRGGCFRGAVLECKLTALARDFSRRTENVKVAVERVSTSEFRLRVTRLSPLTPSQRCAGPSCAAEVPGRSSVSGTARPIASAPPVVATPIGFASPCGGAHRRNGSLPLAIAVLANDYRESCGGPGANARAPQPTAPPARALLLE